MREAFLSFLAAWPAPAQTVNESKPRRVLPVSSSLFPWPLRSPLPLGRADQLELFPVPRKDGLWSLQGKMSHRQGAVCRQPTGSEPEPPLLALLILVPIQSICEFCPFLPTKIGLVLMAQSLGSQLWGAYF